MRTLAWLCLLLALPSAAHAELSLFRMENGNVRDGNEQLKKGDTKGALAAYDRAARELPSEGGVHLNRGLALLKQGDLPAAREALQLATRPPASTAVRADAYYDLGLAFYKEAEAKAAENDHEGAQKLFREASDAFKHGLHLRPGDHDGAWNYELAKRRIREQEEQQKKEQEKKDQEKKDQDKQDQDKQDQDKQDQNDQAKNDQQQPDKNKQDQDKQDQAKKEQEKKDQKKPGQDEQEKKPEPSKQEQAKADQPPPVRPDVDRALDALQSGEQNLERLKAMNRAAAERRKPEKDW